MKLSDILAKKDLPFEENLFTVIKKGKVSNFKHTYTAIKSSLDRENYKDLGWLNANIVLPNIKFEELFSNDTGSSCIYVNHEHKSYYSVDMGD